MKRPTFPGFKHEKVGRIPSAIASAALHAAIVVALVGALPSCGEGLAGQPGSVGDPVRLLHGIEEQKPVQVQLLTEGQAMAQPQAPVKCEHGEYTGVGIMSGVGGRVWLVGENTPASRAGLKDDDIILNVDILAPDRYSVGTPLTLEVMRGDQHLRLVVFIGRVCYG